MKSSTFTALAILFVLGAYGLAFYLDGKDPVRQDAKNFLGARAVCGNADWDVVGNEDGI